MKGKREFKWWMGEGSFPETLKGPYDSKEDAVAEGYDCDYVCGFTVVETDKSLVSNTINSDDYAACIADDLLEENDCWDVDGPYGNHWSSVQMYDLAAGIRKAVDTWLMNNQPTTWNFGRQRDYEYFPPRGE